MDDFQLGCIIQIAIGIILIVITYFTFQIIDNIKKRKMEKEDGRE